MLIFLQQRLIIRLRPKHLDEFHIGQCQLTCISVLRDCHRGICEIPEPLAQLNAGKPVLSAREAIRVRKDFIVNSKKRPKANVLEIELGLRCLILPRTARFPPLNRTSRRSRHSTSQRTPLQQSLCRRR